MLEIPDFISKQVCHSTQPHYEDYPCYIAPVISIINNLWLWETTGLYHSAIERSTDQKVLIHFLYPCSLDSSSSWGCTLYQCTLF